MSQQLSKSFIRLGALIGMVALSGLAGCGEGLPDPTESVQYALTGNNTSVFGSTAGTHDALTGSHQTPVTKILAYGSSSFVFGIKLFWGTSSKMFGVTNGGTAQQLNLSGDPVYKIEYATATNKLVGLKFTNSTSSLTVGNVGTPIVAFSDEEAVFTDMESWYGNQDGTNIMWGTKLYYTTP